MEPIATLSGRIMVESGTEYPCEVQISGLDTFAVRTRAPARPCENAVCYLEGIGAIVGRIGERGPGGFVLHSTLSAERRSRIAVRLAWYATRASWSTEMRAAQRIVPDHCSVRVCMPGEPPLEGLILDLSRTGARIRLPRVIPAAVMGAAVTVGKRHASVIRVNDAVIAIQFRLPFADMTFNESVRL